MIALWFGWHTERVLHDRPAWAPLLACALIVLVKRVDWPPALVTLSGVVLAVGIIEACRIRGLLSRRVMPVWMTMSALWIGWAYLAAGWHAASHRGMIRAWSDTRPIVCLGDSLSSGDKPNTGYAQFLQTQLAVPVVDLSQPGITTRDALKQLPAVIDANPQAVVIELGGHDYLKGYGRDATKANLELIIAACQSAGAEVVLMEVPRGFITDPFAGLERELARRHDLELIPDTVIRRLVLWSPYAPPGMWTRGPYLSDDGLHPNRRGSELLAEYVFGALTHVFGGDFAEPTRNKRRALFEIENRP
jgi:lysophospholipase L1-like esterase